MKIGVVGSYGSVGQMVTMAEAAEEHGWDGFFTWDGISVGPAETWDPWVVLGAVAARTRTITLGALVFSLARRRPWKVARESVTVDHLSGGRLVLPVGIGGDFDAGYTAVNGEATTNRERAARLDETLTILERAWTGEPFSFEGSHYTVDDVVLAPGPRQRPRIPVWPVAGWPAPRSMARAARWDGAVLQRVGSEEEMSVDEVAAAVAWLREHRAAAGLGTDSAEYDVVAQGRLPEDPEQAREHLSGLEEAGATWWVEARWDAARDTPESLPEVIRRGPWSSTA